MRVATTEKMLPVGPAQLIELNRPGIAGDMFL
jgi:hypothetical protein